MEQSQTPAVVASMPEPPKLLSHASNLSMSPSESDTQESTFNTIGRNRKAAPPRPTPSPPAVVGTVKVLFDFVSSCDEELTVKVDDILQVVTWDAGDGWMLGFSKLSELKGLFPAAYVEKQENK